MGAFPRWPPGDRPCGNGSSALRSMDHRRERLPRCPAWLEKAREVAAPPQLRGRERRSRPARPCRRGSPRAGRGRRCAGPGVRGSSRHGPRRSARPPPAPLAGSKPAKANGEAAAVGGRRRQTPGGKADHLPQEAGARGLLDRAPQAHHLVGHRLGRLLAAVPAGPDRCRRRRWSPGQAGPATRSCRHHRRPPQSRPAPPLSVNAGWARGGGGGSPNPRSSRTRHPEKGNGRGA